MSTQSPLSDSKSPSCDKDLWELVEPLSCAAEERPNNFPRKPGFARPCITQKQLCWIIRDKIRAAFVLWTGPPPESQVCGEPEEVISEAAGRTNQHLHSYGTPRKLCLLKTRKDDGGLYVRGSNCNGPSQNNQVCEV